MVIPELDKFVLVGGTNLALQLGHRLSVDLDLFTNEPFNVAEVSEAINRNFSDALKLDEMKQTIWYQINGVKTDIVLHQYSYLKPIQVIHGVRLASKADIVAMKLGAASGRGAKKDFWDIAAFLDIYTIKEMVDIYQRKYTTDDIGFIVRSLVYFEDAELQNDPVSLNNTTWKQVKDKIETSVKKYLETA
jgi:predicted nucleotidyltransferase component of viral defense system